MKEFQPEFGQPALIEKREVLEGQSIEVLLGYKALQLEKLSELESNVHLINDVLDGMGYVEEDSQRHNGGPSHHNSSSSYSIQYNTVSLHRLSIVLSYDPLSVVQQIDINHKETKWT